MNPVRIAFLLLTWLAASSAPAQQVIWRCDQNGRAVYQQQPCEGREVGKRDRRTTAQKRAERDAAKREREKETAAEAVAAAASEAASASAASVTAAASAATTTGPAGTVPVAPAKATLGAPKKKKQQP